MKLLIVDDHELLRTGVTVSCRESGLFSEIFECGTAEEATELALTKTPDYILMDISLGKKSGIELTAELKEKGFEGKILILTSYEDDEHIYKAEEAGADGYISKRSAAIEIVSAVKKIQDGEKFFVAGKSWFDVDRIIRSYRSRMIANRSVAEVSFTKRERQVLGWLIQGLTSHEIGEKLKISNKTVDVYRSNILSKFESTNIREVIFKLNQSGLLSKFEVTAQG